MTKRSPAKAKTDAAPATLKPERLKVSSTAVAEARSRLTRETLERTVPAADVFKPYEPAPGVIPKNQVKIAMDECAPVTVWAGNYVNSAIQQGMTFLGYPLLAEMAQRPEYRRVSEIIATECTREGIEFKGRGEEDKTKKIGDLEAELDRLGFMGVIREAIMLDGLFGRGHIYIDTGATDSPDELATSIADKSGQISPAKVKIGSLRALKAVEPAWTYPIDYNSSDPLADNWYNSDRWYVMSKRVHSTRLCTFIGREVPDMLKPAYAFGGLSLSQMVKPCVDNWLRTRQSVSDIVNSFSVFVLSTNLQTILQGGSCEGLLNRADMFNLFRDNSGLMMVDKTNEEFKNVAAPLSTLDTLQAQSQEHIPSIVGIPLIKYTMLQPAGLNASTDGELRSFYDWIHAFQEVFRDPITWIVQAAMISLWGEVDDDITIHFKHLYALSEAEQATVEKTRAETDGINIENGTISPEEARKRLAGDPKSQYEGLDPGDMPEPPVDEGLEGDEPDDDGGAEPAATGEGSETKSKEPRGNLKPKKVKKVSVEA